jgi:isocitrate/isopropylmalate dehydrogenase
VRRKAQLIRISDDGKKAFYLDEENSVEIMSFLRSESANLKKFNTSLDLILNHRAPRDLYDKENFEKGCEHVTAIKLFKGKKNPRIYCQQYTDGETERFVIIGIELLEKKKSQKLTSVEKSIIRRVSKFEYDLTPKP